MFVVAIHKLYLEISHIFDQLKQMFDPSKRFHIYTLKFAAFKDFGPPTLLRTKNVIYDTPLIWNTNTRNLITKWKLVSRFRKGNAFVIKRSNEVRTYIHT